MRENELKIMNTNLYIDYVDDVVVDDVVNDGWIISVQVTIYHLPFKLFVDNWSLFVSQFDRSIQLSLETFGHFLKF